MTPSIRDITPNQGPTLGGNLVRLTGAGMGANPRVLFGDSPALVSLVVPDACYVRAPVRGEGVVDVVALNGNRMCTVQDGYRYVRPALTAETHLARLVRALLREFKAHIATNTSISVDVEYAPGAVGEEPAAALASLPALVLAGPNVRENRAYSTNVGREVVDDWGNFFSHKAPYTIDLSFHLVGASASTIELLNLLDAVLSFFHERCWLGIQREPRLPELGEVRWPLQLEGETRTHFDSQDGVKSFSCTFVVRGFDIGTPYPSHAVPANDRTAVRSTQFGGVQ